MNFAKKYYIKTFGCQANIADSGTMGGIVEALGFEKFVLADRGDESVRNDTALRDDALEEVLRNVDLLIINTCSVRQKSEDKIYGMGKMIKKVLADSGKKPTIILSGCMVGSAVGERKRLELGELKKKMPWVDAYISPADIHNLPNVLSFSKKVDLKTITPVVEGEDFAYVNISTGCDNFCSYCVVPYARGKEVSHSHDDIVRDVKNLIDRGYKRIMLCGQNVNSWGLGMAEKFKIRSGDSKRTPFANLLREVRMLDGLEELAFISSNPFDFTQELIEVLKLPKMSKYLHIAVQSGNNEVLKKMNRRHTVEEFISLVRDIEKAIPDIELGTDIIVGFSGETREQFMDTVELFKKVKFKVAFISIYSPRKGTPAEKFYKDDVSLKEKKWRHAYLTKIWREGLKNGR
ncbi:MAG: MiaB/RimO family radical SAM methylthiotransferase [Patescibacteria group bacterium]